MAHKRGVEHVLLAFPEGCESLCFFDFMVLWSFIVVI